MNFPWWIGLGPIYNIVGAAVTHGDGYSIGAVVSGTDAVYWESFNEGLPGLFVNDLAVDDTYINAATSNHGVWRRAVADVIATPAIELSSNETLPIFPNPPNGVFSFTIDLEKPENAILLFSDINGRIWHSTNWLIANGFNQIELPFAPPGVSFFTLLTKHDKMTAKVIFD